MRTFKGLADVSTFKLSYMVAYSRNLFGMSTVLARRYSRQFFPSVSYVEQES